MEPFRFKAFSVQHHASTMKVGTDAVLLGAWGSMENAQRILDVGTGCGVIALIAAQRSTARVDAIEPDEASVQEAAANFASSPWPERLTAYPASVQDWDPPYRYDHILSNPPYFSGQLRSPVPGRNKARHATDLDPETLARHCLRLLAPNGRVSLVLPFSLIPRFSQAFRLAGATPVILKPVKNRHDLAPALGLLEFRPGIHKLREESSLILHDEHGARSPEYADLTRELYL
jgi:tRNA1Val (adenine37-N6)-methyltransferase